ncbi:hypothetical protein C8Q75DRAFT_802128 [Abortiporus biennis]|nr:hypothetical protein C8Q75DRAFT_802128 [Abortiporus biennis]
MSSSTLTVADDSLRRRILALTTLLSVIQPTAGLPLTRCIDEDQFDSELTRPYHHVSNLLSKGLPRKQHEGIDLTITGSVTVKDCALFVVVSSPDGITVDEHKWQVEEIVPQEAPSPEITPNGSSNLFKRAASLLPAFLATRESPSHERYSALQTLIISQQLATLNHLVSLQDKLYHPSLFSRFTSWTPAFADLPFLNEHQGYYPVDASISTLLSRHGVPKEKASVVDAVDEGTVDPNADAYLLNKETVIQWFRVPSTVLLLLQRYLQIVQTDFRPSIQQESLTNIASCLRVLYTFLYKTDVVKSVLFRLPSFVKSLKTSLIVKDPRHGEWSADRLTRASDFRLGFEELEETDFGSWLDSDDDDIIVILNIPIDVDQVESLPTIEVLADLDPSIKFTLHYLRSLVQYQRAITGLTRSAVLMESEIPIKVSLVYTPSVSSSTLCSDLPEPSVAEPPSPIPPSPVPPSPTLSRTLSRTSTELSRRMSRASFSSRSKPSVQSIAYAPTWLTTYLSPLLDDDIIPFAASSILAGSSPASSLQGPGTEENLKLKIRMYLDRALQNAEQVHLSGSTVHPEAWTMGLIVESTTRDPKGKDKHVCGLSEDVLEAFATSSGVIGSPREICWCCRWLSRRLNRQTKANPSVTPTLILPPPSHHSDAPGTISSQAIMRPWVPAPIPSVGNQQLLNELEQDLLKLMRDTVAKYSKITFANHTRSISVGGLGRRLSTSLHGGTKIERSKTRDSIASSVSSVGSIGSVGSVGGMSIGSTDGSGTGSMSPVFEQDSIVEEPIEISNEPHHNHTHKNHGSCIIM